MALCPINDISKAYYDLGDLDYALGGNIDALDSAQKAESSADFSCAEKL